MKTYERIVKFVPAFYRDVFEMNSIYQVDGEMLDDLLESVNRVKLNRFILTADEELTERMERFLGLAVHPEKELDSRRKLVAAYFAGFGKMSGSKIKSIISTFTGADSKVVFCIIDDEGNNGIVIEMNRGANSNLNYGDIDTVLSERIPAHILYKTYIKYSSGIVVSVKNMQRTYNYKLCGLIPDVSLIADKNSKTTVAETDMATVSYGANYPQCGTAVAGSL